MTEDTNKSQHILYLQNIEKHIHWSGLLNHIEKNNTNSIVLYLSKNNCRADQSKILEYLDSFSIDSIVNFNVVSLCLEFNFLSKIKSNYDVKLIGIQNDVSEYFDSYYVYVSQFYDLVLLDDSSELQRYKNYGFNAEIFYHGVSKKYLVDPGTKRDIDISFVGRMDRPGRSELLSSLSDKGFSVSVFGYGSKNGYIPSNKMMEIYGRSKIVLNLTSISINIPFFDPNRTIKNRLKQTKGRIYEGMVSGALVLTEPDFSLSIIGVNGEDFVVFNSPHELIHYVDYYLNNKNKRLLIARSGFEKVITHGTYESTANNLEALIEQTSKSKIGKIYVDKVYHKFISRSIAHNYINSLIHLNKPDISCIYGKRVDFLIFGFFWALFYYPYNIISNKIKSILNKFR